MHVLGDLRPDIGRVEFRTASSRKRKCRRNGLSKEYRRWSDVMPPREANEQCDPNRRDDNIQSQCTGKLASNAMCAARKLAKQYKRQGPGRGNYRPTQPWTREHHQD